jgi:hypothetical protein
VLSNSYRCRPTKQQQQVPLFAKAVLTAVAVLRCCAPGDHALTGLAIGKMLGIAGNGSVVTGPELDAMSDEQLKLVSWFFLWKMCSTDSKAPAL